MNAAEPTRCTSISGPFEGVPDDLQAALVRRGFTELTPVQQAVLAAGAEPRDLRISSQTGSGKTIALGLALGPDLARAATTHTGEQAGVEALVLVPTRELAAQVRDELDWLYAELPGLRTTLVTGGTSVFAEQKALARTQTLVVGTPGRVLDHLRSGSLHIHQLAHVVLDEADRMLDLGFREELDAILSVLPPTRRTHLVSATFPRALQRLADRAQNAPLHIEGTPLGSANADIEHIAHVVLPHERYGAIVNTLLAENAARTLVFVQRRIDTTELAARLAADGFNALPFSGELPQSERNRTLLAFRHGRTAVLVATDVAARGIDVPGIETVIHADLPGDSETYVHRSGRTGRAGERGRSVLILPPRARHYVENLLKACGVDAAWRPVATPKNIQKRLRKRHHNSLSELLDTPQPITPGDRAHAEMILENREAADVVARLIQAGLPKLACAPHSLADVSQLPQGIHRKPGGLRTQRRDSSSDVSHTGPRGRAQRGFVRFRVNWGERSGATPSRILSHVCRRGQIASRDVGAIRIDATSSQFDIAGAAASRFESHATRRDARDPKLVIQRDEGRPRPLPPRKHNKRA